VPADPGLGLDQMMRSFGGVDDEYGCDKDYMLSTLMDARSTL
jgi:hypothetical protein